MVMLNVIVGIVSEVGMRLMLLVSGGELVSLSVVMIDGMIILMMRSVVCVW